MGAAGSKPAKSVVVVDDHADMRDFVKAALEREGYEVRTAADGGHALASLGQRGADLLITDIFMPGVQGFETISRCRAEFPEMKIIVISGGTILGLKHDFLSTAALLHVSATLRKPFTAEQLLGAVRKVLPGE